MHQSLWSVPTKQQASIHFIDHTNQTMKRQRETKATTLESSHISNCSTTVVSNSTSPEVLVYECKPCNRKFSSFQALGGHVASHKRPKLEPQEQLIAEAKSLSLGIQSDKPKSHECSICGQGFSLGQALGGHMKRHRVSTNEAFSSINKVVAKVSVLKRSCCTKVFCLDLNLTPLENDLKLLLFGNMAPKVNLSSF